MATYLFHCLPIAADVWLRPYSRNGGAGGPLMSSVFGLPENRRQRLLRTAANGRQKHMSERSGQDRKIDSAKDADTASLAGRFGRRALMLGAAAAGAGAAASLVGGVAEAAPASGIVLGKNNTTSGSTIVTSKKGTGF